MKQYLSIIFLLLGFGLFAQTPKVKNLQQFDQKRIHFGFSLGVNSAHMSVHRKPYNSLRDSLSSIDVISQSGFNLGIVSEFHIHEYLGIRFVPTLVFGQRNFDYKFVDPLGDVYIESRIVESTYLDFPVLFKYRSARLNNFAAYIVAGAKYSIDLASNEDVDNRDIAESIVKLKKNTTSAEVGVGADFFLPYFKFAIELKMAYTLDDALIHDNTELSNPVEKMLPKMFFVTFLFEG
jgi:hypothetical protein